MLRESFERRLIDSQNDVAHPDPSALCCRLAWEKLFDSHHAGAVGFTGNLLLPAETETQAWCVLQQPHLKHIICGERGFPFSNYSSQITTLFPGKCHLKNAKKDY